MGKAAAPVDALVQRMGSVRTPNMSERAALAAGLGQSVALGRNYTLAAEGDKLSWTYLVEQGWFLRSRSSRGGHRHSMHVYLPGDVLMPYAAIDDVARYDVVSATPGRLSLFAPSAVLSLTREHPKFAGSIFAAEAQLVERALLYGCHSKVRAAADRVLFLFLELWTRLRLQGLATSDGFDMPLSQGHIADICGLSLVHTNKSIGQLRQRKLVRTGSRRIVFPDLARAIDQSDFTHPSLDGARG